MKQDLASREVVPAPQCFSASKNFRMIKTVCAALQRNKAVMSCCPTILAFFLSLSEGNVREFFHKHAV